ncbi:hypothetical protein MM1S1540310_0605 [Mycobacteroides abscessus subsp. bolletii 1S-154-0310]|uniref:Uncharacterized protein n=1 Tax=Mycobacteroides abscessus 1948 TaxID=1299323 RepID=A0A829QQW0_9MYCO|nr:hypothetical protein MA5S0421_0312 [Mycobacteroides abscessus 5S-0421]EIU43966.1 hypothetical protein MA5S1215_2013 [Mycobacteroides abscessus 5S-1215]EIU81672.1 hypothetical protein MM1S1530915_0592 [Mycobacteroides abscessus subsp. bolletii 1S-153-0915]EIU84678.1 hypothetical protein MM1S1540310_0605 [Mycobacteroides abscessus subsp. bolletii 1S-154-0310]EUA64936.1 hypothetical protein I542_5113 [Mycobacteroides abscessus 1948]EUA77779.1 hypothetical protein I541_2249 [Mycobacteroides abs
MRGLPDRMFRLPRRHRADIVLLSVAKEILMFAMRGLIGTE